MVNDARVLTVGSESGVARGWIGPLREAGANISVVADGASALRHLDLLEPELILLDLHLSRTLDGFDTCRAIRARSATIIVMASPREGPYDEVVALAVGADHFVPGATAPEVVGAPGPGHAAATNSHGTAHDRQRVGGVDVALTRIEFDLLATLARHPRRVFSRDRLMASAWEVPFDGSHVLDAHLSRMRGRITAVGGERVAHSVRGVGYRLRA